MVIGKTVIPGIFLATVILGGSNYLQDDTLAAKPVNPNKAINQTSDKAKTTAEDKVKEGHEEGDTTAEHTAIKEIDEMDLMQQLIDNMIGKQK